ncbi:MAG: glycosyltransferase family 2 protein [Candidatus Methanoperedens sp.]|nr:glycosyltransferase family 2 protein [Candidatus Methanoperedens sp.]
MKISIIIPTYNRAIVLEKTLPTYLKQKFVNEIIIVDDASTDSTEENIKCLQNKYPNLFYIKHDVQKGAAFAKRTGITYSKCDLILFGEDDVYFDGNYSQQLIECMKKNNADIIAGRIIYKSEKESDDESITRCDKIHKPLIDFERFEGNFSIKTNQDTEVPFVHACYLARKQIFDVIIYDKNYGGNGYREETDPQISALKSGFKIIFCPHAICYHLPRQKVNKGGQWKMNRLFYEYWTIKNNHYFLKKFYPFLKENYKLKQGLYLMLIGFLIERIYKLILGMTSAITKIRFL